MTINVNALDQQPIAGSIDLQVNGGGGVFNGKLGTISGTIKPGARVKLDATATGKVPTFVAAAVGDVAHGVIIRTVMQASYVTGDRVQVASPYRGPVMYFTAFTDLVPGTVVEMMADGTVQAQAAQATFGIVLDYMKAGTLGRVILDVKHA